MRAANVIAISEPVDGPKEIDTDTLIRKVADTLHRSISRSPTPSKPA